ARKRKETDSQWSTCYRPFLPPTTQRWIRSPSLHEMDRRTLETRISSRARDSAGTSEGEETGGSSVGLVGEREASNWNRNRRRSGTSPRLDGAERTCELIEAGTGRRPARWW